MSCPNTLYPVQGIELCPSGALPAWCDSPSGPELHETSFFTALGWLALDGRPDAAGVRTRMQGFLERCERPRQRGAFGFWPAGQSPVWAQAVPPDADDTALCLTVLYRAGCRSRADAIRQCATVLLPNRQPADPFIPAWLSPGAFSSWLVSDRAAPNAIDCAVNANVLTLFATLDMRDVPGAQAAICTICDGLAWAGSDPVRLRALTPFYPEPRELALALERAVAAGVTALSDPLASLRRAAPGLPSPDAVLCAGAYRRDGWRAPALHALRDAPGTPINFQSRRLVS